MLDRINKSQRGNLFLETGWYRPQDADSSVEKKIFCFLKER